jgi:hypothetical protein
MIFKSIRKRYTDRSTISDLTITDDTGNIIFTGYLMEPKCRTESEYVTDHTAIPAGKYLLSIYNSPDHGGQAVILFNGTPEKFGDIEMHIGNWATADFSGSKIDTLGCNLTGLHYQIIDDTDDEILSSTIAFNTIKEKTFDRIKQGNVYIEIFDTFLPI